MKKGLIAVKELKALEKDFAGSTLDSIGKSEQTGYYHFIFKKGKRYFGIAVSKFDTYEYRLKPSTFCKGDFL